MMKNVNSAKIVIPLHGSPIHKPFVPSMPIVLMIGSCPRKTAYPIFSSIHKDQREASLITSLSSCPHGLITQWYSIIQPRKRERKRIMNRKVLSSFEMPNILSSVQAEFIGSVEHQATKENRGCYSEN